MVAHQPIATVRPMQVAAFREFVGDFLRHVGRGAGRRLRCCCWRGLSRVGRALLLPILSVVLEPARVIRGSTR
jgi:hypothetical protein